MRTLINVPMLHSQEALAGQADLVGQNVADGTSQIVSGVSKRFWDIVDIRLSTQNPKNARFYLEGYSGEPINVLPGSQIIPVEGKPGLPERKITDFIKRVGGVIERTEDQSLMDQTFEAAKNLSDAQLKIDSGVEISDDDMKDEQAAMNKIAEVIGDILKHGFKIDELSDQRDLVVADNIRNSLPEDGIGFLFLGGTHDVVSRLPEDIRVEDLDPRLDEIRNELNRELKPDIVREITDGGSPESRG